MDDILNQGEIDALMAGLDSEMNKASEESVAAEAEPEEREAEAAPTVKGEKKIKRYDFKRPDRFSKDQLRMLEMMHEAFARHFGTTLSAFIRTIAEISVVSVRQSSYGEYVNGLSSPTALTVFSFEPLRGNCMLEFNPSIIFPIIDRVLGGPGHPIAKERDLTDIEQVVVGKLAVKALDSLRDAWERVARVTPEIVNKETNPQFVQLVAPSEMCLVIKFSLNVKEHKGVMSLCFPYMVLEAVVQKLSTQKWFTSNSGGSTPETRQNLQNRLRTTGLPVSVQMGTLTLTAAQLMKLKPGDVIPLNKSVSTQLDVFVENKRKFGGKPGVHSKRKAVMITTVYADESEA
ncbi:MAG TPA: flagellar motor switch protein FliM [bacterium]|jgi:flagellar motor switch protein FliM|nr:flagellar motor switch protein FliM [bacterium]